MTMEKVCRRLTAQQLAERWGCSIKKLANSRVSGDGPAYIKLGKAKNSGVVYRLKDVRAFEKANLVRNTSQHRLLNKEVK